MRRILVIVLAIAAVLAVPALAATNKFTATLNGKSETPPTKSAGSATASFVITQGGKAISYKISAAKKLSGPVQAIHIHFGKKGKAGPVILPICLKPCTLPKSGKLTKKQFAKAAGVSNFAAAVKDLRAGKTYVNIHTAKNPGGEIRGQIKPKK